MVKKMSKFVIGLLLVSQVCLATEPLPALKFVDKDELAPFAGYLFNVDAAQKIRVNTEEKKYYENLSNSLLKVNQLQDQNLKIYEQRVDIYNKELISAKDDFWKNALYFSLGAVLAGTIGYGVYRSK